MNTNTTKGRRLRRPIPPTGRPEERCDALYRSLLSLIDELERELGATESKLAEACDELAALKREKG